MAKEVYLVAFYEIDRQYGGPEEGGWWYDSGELVRLHSLEGNKEEAYRKSRRLNGLLRLVQRGRKSVGSVIYDGGRFAAVVYKNKAPDHYPEERPHYE
jgi:hypothetical protein